MFWKQNSEWAKLSPGSPVTVQFGLASVEGYKKLVLLPQDPAAREFLQGIDGITEQAIKPGISHNKYESLIADLEAIVTKFAQYQRNSVETSLAEVHEGLKNILQSLESAMKSSHDLEERAEQSSHRLTHLQTAKSYEELVSGVRSEVKALNDAVKSHRDNEKVIRDVAAKYSDDLRSKLREAEAAVKTDHLTKLGNRAAFDLHLSLAIGRVQQGEAYSLAVLDVDKFKGINDGYGHATGDAALTEVGKRLKETFSLSGCSVVRLGGDEFAIIYKGNVVQLEAKLERVNSILCKASIRHGGQTISIRVSYGVVALTRTHTSETAFQQADQAMYKAKRKVA